MSRHRSKLINLIKQQGPISVADFMNYCLFDPQHGYYLTHSPIGQKGDFITASEVSQLFGEMIGLWILHQWEQRGHAGDIALVELGPGRGTLMSDLLRTVALRPNFIKNLSIHLLEINPNLTKLQKDKLKDHPVMWYTSLAPLLKQCEGKLTYIIANEFFDTLPIQQFIYQGQWFERLINYNTTFSFDYAQHPTDIEPYLYQYPTPKKGDIFEISPQASQFFSQLLAHFSHNKGGMLIIDYGYTKPLYGESLQAVQQHRYVDIFADPGQCDLTAHVNFWQLLQLIRRHDGLLEITAHVTTQRQFLLDHGIRVRAEQLMLHKPASVQKQILTALDRLISPQKMGELFKVLEVYVR